LMVSDSLTISGRVPSKVMTLTIQTLLHNIPEIQIRYLSPVEQVVELPQESHDMLFQKDNRRIAEQGFPGRLSPYQPSSSVILPDAGSTSA
ncbi:hypothetical protein KKH13_04630, partial [Patescibacteria group bacterium]|nr:hypothetical protein [Patescibacteria group bacterium]